MFYRLLYAFIVAQFTTFCKRVMVVLFGISFYTKPSRVAD